MCVCVCGQTNEHKSKGRVRLLLATCRSLMRLASIGGSVFCRKFSKVIALVHLLYEITEKKTCQNLCLQKLR